MADLVAASPISGIVERARLYDVYFVFVRKIIFAPSPDSAESGGSGVRAGPERGSGHGTPIEAGRALGREDAPYDRYR